MRDRSRLISVEISKQAKAIYDGQPHKGEFVSDAIVEKHSHGTVTRAEYEELERRVKELEGK